MRKMLAKKHGFTLIEMMVVVAIVAVLATVGIPAFMNYIRRSKTSEAASNLKSMFVGAQAYYRRDSVGRGAITDTSVVTSRSRCSVTTGSTSNVPSSRKTVLNWATEPSRTSFESLNTQVADPIYYQYSITAANSGLCGGMASTAAVYTFQAIGNLDGDAIQSRFELAVGSNTNNDLYRAPGIFVQNELE